MPTAGFPRVAGLKGIAGLRARLDELGVHLPSDDQILAAPASPLAAPLSLGHMCGAERVAVNRFVIQPMEGWDGTPEGLPSPLTLRRWRHFGASGAGWIWGGEAVAVDANGRANPHQLLLTDATAPGLEDLRRELITAAAVHGYVPVVGLQLTHSGRWATRGPRVAFRHPLLDRRVGITDDAAVLSDAEVGQLIGSFARATYLAQQAGFEFVDLKHCHGYLLHEFLAARDRPGMYGGATLRQRTQLLGELIAAMRTAAPAMEIAVRLSVFDCVPHRPDGVDNDGRPGRGIPEDHSLPYRCAFGLDPDAPERIDLSETMALVHHLRGLGVRLLNVTAGSPYYVPHVQRPAAFPPSDGYAPPEDPLVGVVRLLEAARAIKMAAPDMIVVSSGWTYLQEYLPHVAQACVREGWCDAVGLGRMALAYPSLPADVLAGRPLDRKRLCRTFSDCTTAPRNGLVSGCYPLDPFYTARPEREALREIKSRRKRSRNGHR